MKTTSNLPRVLTTSECAEAFAKYIPKLGITPISKGRMWKASMVLRKYKDTDLEDLPFILFHAYSEEELNLQAQWKIASCYHAMEIGEMTEAEGFMWIETLEWGAYELSKIPDEVDEDDEDYDEDTLIDENGVIWPYILILGEFDDDE